MQLQELTIARPSKLIFFIVRQFLVKLRGDIYEYAVVRISVKTEDQDAFERDFFQLKPYYYVDARSQEPSSALSARASNSWSEPTATACSERDCSELELLSSATL